MDPNAVFLILLWVLAIGLFGGLVAYVLYQSVYILGSNQKIFFYSLGGSYLRTVVSSTYFNTERGRIQQKGGNVKVASNIGAEIAFGLWPLVLGYRVTTTQFEVPIHASQMYTRADHKTLPRVRMEGDATLQFRLSDNPTYLGLAFPLFDQGVGSIMHKEKRDLTHQACLKDTITSSGGERIIHEHNVQRVALIFHSVLNKPMQEAMREAASYWTFSTSEGEDDIIRNRERFEKNVRSLVVADEGSVFREARLFDDNGNPSTSLLVGDLIVENLQLQPARY
jgi:hypothetical protein